MRGCWTLINELFRVIVLLGLLTILALIVGQIFMDYKEVLPGKEYNMTTAQVAPTSEDALWRLSKASSLNDEIGVEQLLNNKEIVQLNPGNRVLVLESHLTFWSSFWSTPKTAPSKRKLLFVNREVRVLDGYARGTVVFINHDVLSEAK